jgi:hypothetical protein
MNWGAERKAARTVCLRVFDAVGFEAKWAVLSFVAGLELGIMHLRGETQWLTVRYVKAKRPSNAQNVREQEK